MVAGKVMRWSPWAPSAAAADRKKRYQVMMRVTRLEGLRTSEEGAGWGVAAVAIRWKGPPRAGGVPYLRRRRKQAQGVSRETPVGDGGVAEWDPTAAAEEDEGAFANVCCFCRPHSDSNPRSFRPWDVSFSLLHGFENGGRRKEKKLAEIGSASVNIAEWASASKSQMQDKGGQPQLHVQQRQIQIALPNDRIAMLYVNVRFVEVMTSDEAQETPATREGPMEAKKEKEQEEGASDGRLTDDSFTFDTDIPDLSQLLQLADESDKLVTYSSRNRAPAAATTTSSSSSSNGNSSSGGSSPELLLGSPIPKSRFLPWRKKRKTASKSTDDSEGESRKAQSTSSDCSTDADPIGKWEDREFASRDGRAKLKAQAFFASIDQRDESAGGESACTALVAVIADALHSSGASVPTRSEFDALIREGSSEWRKLCGDASYIGRFPNRHFDLDTVLEAKVRPVSVLPEKSFIGFFQPESFESLRGAMSFEGIWDEISRDAGNGGPKVYIVSWNDHFFLLKVEAEAYYLMDTLGERLFEGCNRAYMLRFDGLTEMYRLAADSGRDELICRGKECCREFIKEFLAAIPVREELEIEEKGSNGNTALHQRLQIEFHHTKACHDGSAVGDDADDL